MAVATEEEKNIDKEDKNWTPGKVLGVVAYPASAAVALSVAHANIEEKSFEKLKEGPLKKIAEGIRQKITDVSVKVEIDPKTLEPIETFVPNVSEKIADIRKKGRIELKEAASVMGFKNISDHYNKNLNIHNRHVVNIESLTAGAITLGVLLTISNSTNILKELFGKKDHKKDGGDKTISRNL